MTTQSSGPQVVQWRGGPTAQAEAFIGSPREITIDTTLWNLHVHDGVTAGGHIIGAVGSTPDHRWVGATLQFQKPNGDWGDIIDLGQELTQTQLDAIIAEGTTQLGLVTAEGTTQVNRVITEGDTQVARLGTNVVGTVPYDIAGTWAGVGIDDMFMTTLPFPRTVTFPINFLGSYFTVGTAPTADTVFKLFKGVAEIGTVTVLAGQTTGTFSVSVGQTFTSGETLHLRGPATADTTLADIAWVLVGTCQLTAAEGAFFDIGGVLNGKPASGSLLIGIPMPRVVTFPVNLSGSQVYAEVAATAETVFTIYKNETQIGTITFAAASTAGVVSMAEEQTFNPLDKFIILAPVTVDASLANIGWIITGAR